MTDFPRGIDNPTETQKRTTISRRPINEETKEWMRDLDTQLPILGTDIPNFKHWINWNGFQLDRNTGQGHEGFDFAAYLTTDDKIILGLPPETKIRAVADGRIAQVSHGFGGPYGYFINVEHGKEGEGMFAGYHHVAPKLEQGSEVKKGDIIATLYKDPGEYEGRLVHLHFNLVSAYGTRGTSITGGGLNSRADDPMVIDSSIYKYSAIPQGNKNFTVAELPNVEIKIANFSVLKVNE